MRRSQSPGTFLKWFRRPARPQSRRGEIRQRRCQRKSRAPIPQRRRHRAHRKNDRHAGGECLFSSTPAHFVSSTSSGMPPPPPKMPFVSPAATPLGGGYFVFSSPCPPLLCKKRPRRFCLLLAEALAVGALIHGGIGLMGADLNGVQAAVGLTLAMVRAGSDLAFDGSVGGCRRNRWYDRT